MLYMLAALTERYFHKAKKEALSAILEGFLSES